MEVLIGMALFVFIIACTIFSVVVIVDANRGMAYAKAASKMVDTLTKEIEKGKWNV